ncbi:penicillin-binding protein 2 [Nitratifractor salsuginis]|uniref:Peptidoglycan glycosyltransferase n=1 Tax=Nitratifractor salsuginis (strain DSM 16511 / JCM 12458 / E9I37-1) TaxID=749222 RepID=E6X362_NITSE|nr:penicillin-binding protein 2 [Nitratifractor salsuginis]ADV46206.1 peptidoglycan glycosyltransferase [Nitratifractor salsuginis DSM 16511]
MRFKIVLLIFAVVWAILIVRLYHISIKSNFYYEKLAKENIERKNYIKPVRGEIFDTHGNFLAVNKIGFSLSLAPHLSSKKGELQSLIATLKGYFPDINATVMERVYRKQNSPYNYRYIKVIDFIPYAEMMRFYPRLSAIPQIKIDTETKRYYPYGRFAAHIVGYVGRANRKEIAKDKVASIVGYTGKSGLERYYNRLLEGEPGYIISKVNARNKALEVLERKEPVNNRSLKVNLDMDLQKFIYDLLEKRPAVVVVMRTTGEVLAAVSNPSFDPNLFVGGISVKDWKALQNNLGHPFTNKFIHAVYPPGSVIKMGVALAASKAGKGILDEHEYCKGYITIDKSKHKFRCWKKWGHGDVDLRKSIRESCDVYYYEKSLKIGIDKIAKTLKRIGLGVRTGIDLPREYRGIIPDKAWKRKRYHLPWYKGETVIAAIGQGYDNITPMQVARYTAFLATGWLPTPTLAQEIDGKKVTPKREKIAFNPIHMSIIRQGMIDVCNDRRGTAYKALHKLPIKVAAKTGTAQVVSIPQEVKKRVNEKDLAYFKKSHAWITTYAPAKNPEYVVTVLVEHGGHGGSAAGPIAAKIYQWLYYHGYFKHHPLEEVEKELAKRRGDLNTTQASKLRAPKLRMDQTRLKVSPKN